MISRDDQPTDHLQELTTANMAISCQVFPSNKLVFASLYGLEQTGDPIRDKSRQLIYDALMSGIEATKGHGQGNWSKYSFMRQF